MEILRSTQNDTRETCHPESFDCHSEQGEESQDKLSEGFGRELPSVRALRVEDSRTDLWQNDPLPRFHWRTDDESRDLSTASDGAKNIAPETARV